MCGFVAGLGRRPIVQSQIETALKTIAHRGPDGHGIWLSDDKTRMLGHVRLSIIGLDNGAQPISNPEGTVHIVVNGEFYGYQDIREDLRAEGCEFSTASDSEIILHLYLTRGLDGLDALQGEFAIVIMDERRGEMIAVRDRFGIKPLFYAEHEGGLYFASEIKALLALGVPAKWDRAAAYGDGFLFRHHERTLFQSIRSVPQGHYAIASTTGLRIHPYWDWTFPTSEDLARDTRSETECVYGFREVFREAIKTRLVADVDVGCYLSGGVDSCAVLGLAQEALDRPIQCYTLSFDDAMYDEAVLAERQARHSGADFYKIPVTRRDIADAYSDAVWHAETPMVNGNGTAKFLLSKWVQAAGIKTVLTGEGADELLGGYVPFRRDYLLQHGGDRPQAETDALMEEMFASNAATRAVFMRTGQDDPAVQDVIARLGWVPSFMESYAQLGRITTTIYRDDFNQEMESFSPFSYVMDRVPYAMAMKGRDALNQALYLNSKTHLPNFILTFLADRMEMAHSVEGRVPFLDHRVAEYVANLPLNMKIHGVQEKYVLREAAKHVLVDDVYIKEKHPFSAPPSAGEDPMLELYEDVIASKAFAEQPIYDPEKAKGAFDMFKMIEGDQRIAFEGLVQRVISTALMHERFAMT
ncbi:MAG: asparagine synthase (glutamine-hydrolyzing) [Henriciella sp.]|nr:asparagine synthase (glutamine-hydrolyzing) [Henriciella sp.]